MSHQLFITINNELASLLSTPFEPYIFKVDGKLRRENEKAYEPEILSIGPYHRGKANLQMMEQHKLRYLQLLLNRRNGLSVDSYINVMQDLEEKARKCYAESLGLGKDEFVRMMLLDGCFIIEFFCNLIYGTHMDDSILKSQRFQSIILQDLLVFENQLPFFVLARLLDQDLLDINASLLFRTPFIFSHLFSQSSRHSEASSVPRQNVKHLLGLVHDTWCSSFKTIVSSRQNVGDQGRTWEYMKCTTELREVGIKFEKATESSSLLDINFVNGIMKIPPLTISDSTETIFRNLVAYEQYNDKNEPAYVTDYRKFLGCLVNSPKDAKKLRQYGIIDNWLGDDEAVSTMLYKLGNNVFLDPTTFCYSEIFNKVSEHYKPRPYIWIAKLKYFFFHNTWTIIPIFGFTMSILQTIFSSLQV